MTKKDYELVASIINEQLKSFTTYSQVYRETMALAVTLGRGFELNNPLFKMGKFIEACETGKHIRKSIKQ